MARAQRHSAAPPSVASIPDSFPSAQWPWKLQTLQFNAARDMLGIFNRHVAALAVARDVQALAEARRTVVTEWTTWVQDSQREWAGLARLVPPDAWRAFGWRLKPGARTFADGSAEETPRDVFEQSKLGLEMLLRPWMPAPDLDHTDEFVA